MILRLFQFPLLLLVSLSFLHSSCAIILLQGLYILKFSQLLSLSQFYLLKLPTSIDTHVPLFIMTEYGVRLIVRVGSVGLNFLIP